MIREIVSRAEAKERGLTRYYTGKPCPHGHDSERRVANSACNECVKDRIKAKRKTPEGWEKHTKRLAKYRSGTEKGKASRSALMRKIRATPKGKEAYKGYRSTEEALRRSAERQAQKVSPGLIISPELFGTKTDYCQICFSSDQQIVFDHCHKKHEFRGWLCHRCNLVLGQYEDNPTMFERMASYLKGTLLVENQHKVVDVPRKRGNG